MKLRFTNSNTYQHLNSNNEIGYQQSLENISKAAAISRNNSQKYSYNGKLNGIKSGDVLNNSGLPTIWKVPVKAVKTVDDQNDIWSEKMVSIDVDRIPKIKKLPRPISSDDIFNK